MNLSPVDFFPYYERCSKVRRKTSSIWTFVIPFLTSVILCATGIYYYQIMGKNFLENWKNPTVSIQEDDRKYTFENSLKKIQEDIQVLKEKIHQAEKWRKHFQGMYLKLYSGQEKALEKKIEDALDLYDSDKIGLFDYAATYAGGSIHSTPVTTPFPINKTVSFFNFVKINVLSNPENLLKPNILPGNCFAFIGNEGRIRIKLGKIITIRAVTMDHIKLHEDKSSAPKNFEVYGLTDPDEDLGKLLGNFTYNINGRPFQTFRIHNESKFKYVELHILNNYGKEEFTCLYRFRVHNVSLKEIKNIF